MKGRLLLQEKLAKYTSWRVGGVADCLYIPHDRADLVAFMRSLPADTAVLWLGLGSNVLVRDGGVRGTVIYTQGRLKSLQALDDTTIYVEAGVPCAKVAKFCAEQSLVGAEFLAGIPGTMGGALKMNAGAFGGETWDMVRQVDIIDKRGQIITRSPEEFTVSYRSVIGRESEWFLSAQLLLKHGDTISSNEKIKTLLAQRAKTQPTNQPNCGSVFKNPPNDYAARLIEAAGLKGYRLGGAQVSEKHANFIINTGHATAADIEQLINYIQRQVKNNYGISLQTEVCRVGE